MEVCFERMRPNQLREARQRADVAFVPLGALEWHGPQNPLGLDGLKAHAIACRAAASLNGGAVLPPLFFGVPRDSFDVGRMPQYQQQFVDALGADPQRYHGYGPHGGMDVQEQWLFCQRLLRMTLDSVASFGFKSIYLAIGHYPFIHFARPVAVAFARATAMAGVPVNLDFGVDADLAGHPGDHAGVFETSLMLAANRELVDMNSLRERPELVGVAAGADAVDSSPEQGERWLESCAQAMAAEARWLIDHHPRQPDRHRHRRA